MATSHPQKPAQGTLYPEVPPVYELEVGECLRFGVADDNRGVNSTLWEASFGSSWDISIRPKGRSGVVLTGLDTLPAPVSQVASIVVPMRELHSGPWGGEVDSEPSSVWNVVEPDSMIRFNFYFSPPGGPAVQLWGANLGYVASCNLPDGARFLITASVPIDPIEQHIVETIIDFSIGRADSTPPVTKDELRTVVARPGETMTIFDDGSAH